MACKNCNLSLNKTDNFCNSCGAKVIRNRLTINNLFSDFSAQFLNYDNKFLQTFIKLFTKPEDVICNYINGTRKKYVNVISYFAIAITLSGFQMFILNKFFPELMDMSMYAQEGMEEFQNKNMAFIQDYQSFIFMLLVPIYALFSKVIFFDKKEYNYTEHLVINMYSSAHVSIFSTFIILLFIGIGIDFAIISMLTIPIQIIYFAYTFKRIYKLSSGQTFLKTSLFILVLIIASFIIMVAGALFTLLFGNMDNYIEAKKAIK
ncbi:DUF3667 domain-containing protein [Lacinutrix salivirga]